jgi:hypothetical protein
MTASQQHDAWLEMVHALQAAHKQTLNGVVVTHPLAQSRCCPFRGHQLCAQRAAMC